MIAHPAVIRLFAPPETRVHRFLALGGRWFSPDAAALPPGC